MTRQEFYKRTWQRGDTVQVVDGRVGRVRSVGLSSCYVCVRFVNSTDIWVPCEDIEEHCRWDGTMVDDTTGAVIKASIGESAKQIISEKDFEISNLKKDVAYLTKKLESYDTFKFDMKIDRAIDKVCSHIGNSISIHNKLEDQFKTLEKVVKDISELKYLKDEK